MPGTEGNRYDDIINLPHHRSATRPHMSDLDRAAQFSPFAALTGYDDAIQETARLTDEKIQLTDDRADELNGKLQALSGILPERPEVQVTYFLPDERKKGGRYVTVTGRIRQIDEVGRKLIFADGSEVPIDDVYSIGGDG